MRVCQLKVKWFILALLSQSLIVFSLQAFSDQPIEIFTIQNRPVQEIYQSIKPFLSKDSKVTIQDNQILLQASTAEQQTIKSLINQLDVPVKKLLISVSNGHDAPDEIQSINSAGEVVFGNQSSTGRSMHYGTVRERDQQVNHVRVDNGQVAFISTGITVPLITEQFAANANYLSEFNVTAKTNPSAEPIVSAGGIALGDSQALGQSYDYKNLSNGIYVKPQIVGNQVQLRLLTQNDQPQRSQQDLTQPAYTTFRSQTTLIVPLGQWINFGGNTEQRSGYSYSTRDKQQTKRTLWLRVDLIPENTATPNI